MKHDCTEEYGFYTHGARLDLAGLGECRTARDGLAVTHLDTVPLDAPRFAAIVRARERCAESGTLVVGGPTEQIELECPGQLPAAPGWWTLPDRFPSDGVAPGPVDDTDT